MLTCRRKLKHYAGIAAKDPDVVVKSDAAGDITQAVVDLGWHPQPSLANRWPHNTVHELGIYETSPSLSRRATTTGVDMVMVGL